MHVDFGLLSMTELRTRPGEILDRVADGGEAFIIERGGRRKACLVPLSVFVPDISPARIADEIAELVSELVPPRSNEDMLQGARASAAEHKAITDVLLALSDVDTSFGQATDLMMSLLEVTRPYLDILGKEAFGEAANLNPG